MTDIDWKDIAAGVFGAICCKIGFLIGNSRKRKKADWPTPYPREDED